VTPKREGAELNVVLLEERTPDGWVGAAELECPECHRKTVWRLMSSAAGRAVALWVAVGAHTVSRQTFKR
jgi:hypothetical protein